MDRDDRGGEKGGECQRHDAHDAAISDQWTADHGVDKDGRGSALRGVNAGIMNLRPVLD